MERVVSSELNRSLLSSSAHPMVRVLVPAPNPLSGPSPGRLAGSAFALDSSATAGPSLGLLEFPETTTEALEVSAPGVLTGHSVFHPGGSVGWENYILSSEAHQYVDVAILATFTFNVVMSMYIIKNT